MAWLLKPEVAQAMQVARMMGYQPTAEERAAFAAAMHEAHATADSDRPRNMQVAGDVAEIAIDGVLTEKPDCFALLFGSGNTTYASIRKGLQQADADPAVKKIVLNISSPGGHVTGLFETLAAIEATQKPISVLASQATSAAYGIAATAGPIRASTPAAEFGSIGVAVRLFLDEDVVDIASTEAPKKRPDYSTEEGQAVIREELDALHELFVDAIARGRETKASAVNQEFGRGGVLLAKQARERGMIDSIAPQPRRARAGKRAETEDDAEQVTAPPMTASADGGAPEKTTMNLEQLKAQHPDLYAAIVKDAKEEGKKEGEANERKRVLAHLTLADSTGATKVARDAIASGASTMDEAVHAAYLSASLNRGDQGRRQADSDTAAAALTGATGSDGSQAATGSSESGDVGDQVAARMAAGRGKKLS